MNTQDERNFALELGYMQGAGPEIAHHLFSMADEIDRLTAERDAALASKDKFFDESVKYRKERDALRADAERYRKIAVLDWYVGPEYNTYNDVVIDDYDNFNISKERLDAAIDAAMKGQP